ncbi:unnamed protein product [Ectocarpus sp. 12 AP-2014]
MNILSHTAAKHPTLTRPTLASTAERHKKRNYTNKPSIKNENETKTERYQTSTHTHTRTDVSHPMASGGFCVFNRTETDVISLASRLKRSMLIIKDTHRSIRQRNVC